ncbi:MAG: hypothetical protein EA428_01360 [Spirochaetaceae bacterium]|nr:MAG: hypothetical protein EA428_01360 [Spirochaetaceae bacterium]
MPSFLHIADLHLSRSSQDYSFCVLTEFCSYVIEHRPELVLIAGDIFDEFADAEALRVPFREHIASLPAETRVLAIPGNHDILRMGSRKLDVLDFGIGEFPLHHFQLLHGADLEVLAVPFGASPPSPEDLPPPADGVNRVALVHGTLTGLGLAGPEQAEADDAALDPLAYEKLGVSYIAAGHIHKPFLSQGSPCVYAYPGSARVWRRGEEGPRGFYHVRTNRPGNYDIERVELRASGQYRRVVVTLNADGSLPELHGKDMLVEAADLLELVLTGLVPDDAALERIARDLRNTLGREVRELALNTDDVFVLSGAASHPLARGFLEAWKLRYEQAETEQEREVLVKARELGLRKLKSRIEARS